MFAIKGYKTSQPVLHKKCGYCQRNALSVSTSCRDKNGDMPQRRGMGCSGGFASRFSDVLGMARRSTDGIKQCNYFMVWHPIMF